MKAMTAADAQNRFGQLIEAAQHRPVAVTRHGRPAAIVNVGLNRCLGRHAAT